MSAYSKFYLNFILILFSEAFTYDVRCFLGIFDLPTYPNQIVYYIKGYIIKSGAA